MLLHIPLQVSNFIVNELADDAAADNSNKIAMASAQLNVQDKPRRSVKPAAVALPTRGLSSPPQKSETLARLAKEVPLWSTMLRENSATKPCKRDDGDAKSKIELSRPPWLQTPMEEPSNPVDEWFEPLGQSCTLASLMHP